MTRRLPPAFLWLLALYPPVALLAANIQQIDPLHGLRAMAACLLGMLLLHLGLQLVLAPAGAAILAGSAWLVFFSYGHVYQAIKGARLGEVLIGRHMHLLPAALVLMVGAWLLARRLRSLGSWRPILTLMAASALVLPILTIVRFQLQLGAEPRLALPVRQSGVAPAQLPDLYLILLDAYTRQDVLRQSFGVDNRPFIQALEALGFVVPGCSLSNYSQTELTLASMLNFDYLSELPASFSQQSNDRTALFYLIRHSALRRTLETAGYQTVAFETGYAWSEWQDADRYLKPETGWNWSRLTRGLNAYEAQLVETTGYLALSDARAVLPSDASGLAAGPLEAHRVRVTYVLDQLPNLPRDGDRPNFVFAHIVAPHRPFIFRPEPDSELLDTYLIPTFSIADSPGYIAGYRGQVMYLNGRLPDLLANLIDNSEVPPLILLFGDHGPDDAQGAERLPILQAIHLPGYSLDDDLEGLTPINAVRLLLDEGLGYDLPPLTDRSYYSEYDRPFILSQVENDCLP